MRGYSVFETLIYSSILALVLVFSLASIISSWRGFQKAVVLGQLSRNGEFITDRIVRDIRVGDSVGNDSVFGSHPGVLKIVSGATSTKYSISNLTSSSSRVVNLLFWQELTSSSKVSSQIIKIEFTLESGEGNLLKQKKFFGSAVLRGQY